jgi:hypothetical protein
LETEDDDERFGDNEVAVAVASRSSSRGVARARVVVVDCGVGSLCGSPPRAGATLAMLLRTGRSGASGRSIMTGAAWSSLLARVFLKIARAEGGGPGSRERRGEGLRAFPKLL